ncbi:hypothetical protein LQK80_05445 [Bacillus thuringiensis]|nr:hypothetical protein [Bacillus thuringiensis]
MILNINNDLLVTGVQGSGPNGVNTKPVIQGNQIIWDLDGQPEGTYKVTYKVKEKHRNRKNLMLRMDILCSLIKSLIFKPSRHFRMKMLLSVIRR